MQFQHPSIALDIMNILKEHEIPPELIEIELTESVIMDDTDLAIATLAQFKEMGIKISIDDFGTGYSSLGYLKKFPLDTLKIDKTFIADVCNDNDEATIVLAIILLAEKLNLEVVAEGVETDEQADFLLRNNLRLAQGFYYYQPMPFTETLDILEQANTKTSQTQFN
jgi:EAL domain-containing protein (putative c-di-GMP-specific phosphodiesterase class I)